MIDCCQLSLSNGKLALYIAMGAFAVISLLLAMFFGYNLKLDGRTAKLEKKNGKEMTRIEELERKNDQEQTQINELQKEIQALKEKNHA